METAEGGEKSTNEKPQFRSGYGSDEEKQYKLTNGVQISKTTEKTKKVSISVTASQYTGTGGEIINFFLNFNSNIFP